MIPEIKKILYATDLSENARHALGYAASLANRYGAGITFLHVIEDTSSFRGSLMVNVLGEEKWKKLVEDNKHKVIDKARERVTSFCDEVSVDMPSCPFITDEIAVRIGHPSDEIMKQVKASECDLVVMGARGLGALADKVMGSTSKRILRRCTKPVLIVRLPKK